MKCQNKVKWNFQVLQMRHKACRHWAKYLQWGMSVWLWIFIFIFFLTKQTISILSSIRIYVNPLNWNSATYSDCTILSQLSQVKWGQDQDGLQRKTMKKAKDAAGSCHGPKAIEQLLTLPDPDMKQHLVCY